jgi:hypothetical protein
MHPESFCQSNRQAHAVGKIPAHVDFVAGQSALQPEVRIGNHGVPGTLEKRQIGEGVADVVEAVGGKPLLQMLQFVVTRKV